MKTCKANSKMYQCTKCEFKASSDIAVTIHISKEHGQYTKCSFCVYQTKDFSMMRKHEKKCRGDESIYTCQKCHLQMNFWHYRRHHKTCDGRKITKETKKITCRTCGTHFSSALMLKAHHNLEHEETKRPGKWPLKFSVFLVCRHSRFSNLPKISVFYVCGKISVIYVCGPNLT